LLRGTFFSHQEQGHPSYQSPCALRRRKWLIKKEYRKAEPNLRVEVSKCRTLRQFSDTSLDAVPAITVLFFVNTHVLGLGNAHICQSLGPYAFPIRSPYRTGMRPGSSRPLPSCEVSPFSGESEKNVLVPRFFLPFSLRCSVHKVGGPEAFPVTVKE